MTENGGYATFALYHTLHLHFTTKSYDWFKYHGKCNISKEQFLNRRDKYIFYAISRKYDLNEVKGFFISNLFENSKTWIGELNTSESDEIYRKWLKRNQSLTYRFEQDIIHLFDLVENPNDLVTVKNGQDTILLREMYCNQIDPETFIIMNSLLNFWDMWLKKLNDDVIFPQYLFKFRKYEPFVSFDRNKCKQILLKHINHAKN